ncbi:MAG: NAD(P)/FAD-dependent oxidoreductase [Lachnospiraceae bacterium]|nr:NAD(P)/FAD-dependent oxidoreductase [Lachnospiraceae bacterium]
MMAAVSAADLGHQVTLLEQNEKLGKKLYITGKGRCNVTNDSDVENLLAHVVSNPKFLYSAFYSFDSSRLMDFLESEGLTLKTERGNRVFPASDKSSDVIRTMQNALKKRGVTVELHTKVTGLQLREQNVSSEDRAADDGSLAWESVDTVPASMSARIAGVDIQQRGKKRNLTADAVIVATGGISYPSTGSTGDGYRFARDTGHNLVSCSPSLVPVTVQESYCTELQGLSLKNVMLRVFHNQKCLFAEQGEMLFTHFGVSGPLVLSASSILSDRTMQGLRMEIDLKPALPIEQLDQRLLRDFAERKNGQFKNSLSRLLPTKLIPVIVGLSQIDPEKRVNEVTKQERQHLLKLIKGFPLTPTGLRGYNEAIITKGGVSVRDVNPATMESRHCQGLYFAGEVLDLDALTGGYNLQIAWSTGYLAGCSVPDSVAQFES